MNVTKAAAFALVVVLGGAGCAASGGPQRVSSVAARPDAVVRVANHNWADMNVYLLRSGQKLRLGTVTAMQTALFRLARTDQHVGQKLQLLVDPIGSTQTYTTHSFTVQPGQEVDFTIQNHLPTSSLAIWNR